MSQPESRKSPSLRHASRMATTSACAVGSFVLVTQLAPSATTLPSFTTSAANGPPLPERTFSSPNAMARRMNCMGKVVYSRFSVPFPLQNINTKLSFFCMRGVSRRCPARSGRISSGCATITRNSCDPWKGLLAAPKRTDVQSGSPHRIAIMENHQIGKSVPRKEGREKVTGNARYVDDLSVPEMIYGITVRSSCARGRILGIHFEEGIPWDEYTIVTAKDIPGKNCVALLIEDQPCLADQMVNHPEEAVVLLAHPDKYLLEEA